ncbi:hypothetical protein SUNI508_10550 [Seiridium unicorne]|uniref:Uncharacterized protein n=1 Tax=Seiridium unicorne TaxID=138068 RepID=A0ABR2UL72_9PEZI
MPALFQNRRNQTPSPSGILRTDKSLRRRLAVDTREEGTPGQHRSPKRRDTRTFVPFNPFKAARQDADVPFAPQGHGHYYRRQPSTPESPWIKNLKGVADTRLLPSHGNSSRQNADDFKGKYSDLQIAMHSKVTARLEAAQEELTDEALTAMKANKLALAQFSAFHSTVAAPISKAQARKFMIKPDGTEVPELVVMSDAVADFKKREEAHAEIEALIRDISSPRQGGECADMTKTIQDIESEHAAAVAEFNEDIEALDEKGAGEYKTYEKEFLRKIENEAGKIVQSFVHPGFL